MSETRCYVGVAKRCIRKLQPFNYSIVPSRGKSGGLWLLWDTNVRLEVIKKGQNMIAAQVPHIGNNGPWLLLGVYGDPHRRTNLVIWSQIGRIIEENELPVCILGNFNAIMDILEK